MDVLNRIWSVLKRFFLGTLYVWIALVIAVIVGLIWGTQVGVFTGFGIVLAVILFVFGRQGYWWLTKKGDYNNRNEEE